MEQKSGCTFSFLALMRKSLPGSKSGTSSWTRHSANTMSRPPSAQLGCILRNWTSWANGSHCQTCPRFLITTGKLSARPLENQIGSNNRRHIVPIPSPYFPFGEMDSPNSPKICWTHYAYMGIMAEWREPPSRCDGLHLPEKICWQCLTRCRTPSALPCTTHKWV